MTPCGLGDRARPASGAWSICRVRFPLDFPLSSGHPGFGWYWPLSASSAAPEASSASSAVPGHTPHHRTDSHPARVRRVRQHLRAEVGCPAAAPELSRPGSGRPAGCPNRHRAARPDVRIDSTATSNKLYIRTTLLGPLPPQVSALRTPNRPTLDQVGIIAP